MLMIRCPETCYHFLPDLCETCRSLLSFPGLRVRAVGIIGYNRRMNLRTSEITIIAGALALIVFCCLSTIERPAYGAPLGRLLRQSNGIAYTVPVNERLTLLEYSCRSTLLQLGAAEAGYSSYVTRGKYAYLHELKLEGYLQPNMTGRTLTSDYSITFFLPPGKRGFTLVAEPTDFRLRGFMLTENQRVIPLTPSIEDDPNEDWAEVRELLLDSLYKFGRYESPSTVSLLMRDTLLQVRLNLERTEYALLSLIENPESGFLPDDSFLYITPFGGYVRGDTRELEEFGGSAEE